MKIRALTHEEFQAQHLKLSKKIFTDSLFFHSGDVRTQYERSCHPRLKKTNKDTIEYYLGLFDSKNKLVGWSFSSQVRTYELYMMSSAVFPKHRRKGYYTQFAKKTIALAKKAGFQKITSNHLASNNAVIIAKLKLGFKITGFEIFDEVGVLVKMAYYLNSTRAQAFDFRTGYRPTKKIKKILKL